MPLDDAHHITDLQALKALYGTPPETSLAKELDHIHPHYQAFIQAAPFVAMATSADTHLDVSPRGDPAGFVVVQDPKTLLMPDRRGNNRIDSLRNILRDPRVALLFLIPGVGETLRVNGRAQIRTDPELLARFAVEDKLPRIVLRIQVETVFFQCSRAIVRSRLWDPASQIERSQLPSIGRMISDFTQGTFDGETYDKELPQRLSSTLY